MIRIIVSIDVKNVNLNNSISNLDDLRMIVEKKKSKDPEITQIMKYLLAFVPFFASVARKQAIFLTNKLNQINPDNKRPRIDTDTRFGDPKTQAVSLFHN